jgi:hypothetical protein
MGAAIQRGEVPQPPVSSPCAETPSRSAVLCQPLLGGVDCGEGAVSARNCSRAAAIAAASSGEALAAWISILGRGGLCLPLRPAMASQYCALA